MIETNIVELNVAVRLLDLFARNRRHALAYVDSLGVIERLTSSDVVHKAEAWAYLLRRHDVRPGDRVVVLAARDREWRSALLAVMQVGGVAVPYPAETPVTEVRTIAADAGAVLFVSARARPDVVEAVGTRVLSANDLDSAKATRSDMELVYRSRPGDIALILYGRDAAGLRGATYTHTSLIAQAEDGGLWLGVRENERVWCTAPDGSIESIWLLLAAWRAGAEIVAVDAALDPRAQLELLEKLGASAVWLSDDEYRVLAATRAPMWVTLASIRRALTSDGQTDGAVAFRDAFGAKVAPVYGLKETGVLAGWPLMKEDHAAPGTGMPLPGIELSVVDEQGTELPPGEVGGVRARAGAPSFFAGYSGAGSVAPGPNEWLRLGARGAIDAEGRLRIDSGAPLELERTEGVPGVRERVDQVAPPSVEAAVAAAALISNAPEAPGRDEERVRRTLEKLAKERQRAEERRRRKETKSRELAQRAAAEERRRAEEAEREAARAEERRRAEEERRHGQAEERREKELRHDEEQARREEERLAKEREKAEEQRLREEAKERELVERAAEERRRAKEAEREAARATERRRAEEERRRAEEEKRREKERRGEEKQARRNEEKARQEAERAAREAARAEERRRAEEDKQRAEEEKRREEQRRRDGKEGRRREEQEAKERAEQEKKQAEDEKRREEQRRRGEKEARRKEDQEAKERAEQEKKRAEEERRREKERLREEERQAKEREKTESALRKAALAEERRRAEAKKRETKERAKADELRRREEAKSRKIAEQAEDRKRRKKERRPEPTEQPEPERLAPDILGVLSAYGVKPADPDERRQSAEPSEPSTAAARESGPDGE